MLEATNGSDTVPLGTPREIRAAEPLDPEAAAVVARTRAAIRDLLHGRDRRRLLVVVGPCSIHDAGAALEYARRLRGVAEEARDELVMVMRTYLEKPRTALGWKGLVNDPRRDGSCDIADGVRLGRRILLAVNRLGVACGAELLEPNLPPYLLDCLAWAAVGARTIESQVHRQIASGLPLPVGFKNATDGNLEPARHAMTAARHTHAYLGIDDDGRSALVRTRGNPDRHLVLRGGSTGPNYAPGHVARAADLVAGEGIARPVLVDCSHDNSGKDHTRQATVCREVLAEIRRGLPGVLGLLLESNLEPGRAPWTPGVEPPYGTSITDACMGWDETAELLREAAAAVRSWPSAA